ncbi:MAG TPA: hypothetical protein VF510_11455 [Ktedonobacterales bacterium]
MPTRTWDAIDASAQQHFAFLTERGFVADRELPRKAVHRDGFRDIVYRGERWGVDLYLEYRGGFYDVNLVPLEQGKAREVPFGYRTQWGLADYLSRILGIRDEEINRLKALQLAEPDQRETVEYADEFFERSAALLTRYLDEIVASPHPPVGKE